jgi:hypothetical protein
MRASAAQAATIVQCLSVTKVVMVRCETSQNAFRLQKCQSNLNHANSNMEKFLGR